MDKDSAGLLLKEFHSVVDQIYGLYLDSEAGFNHNARFLKEAQASVKRKGKSTQAYLDSCNYVFSEETPNHSYSNIDHICTQREFRVRNSESGLNHVVLGNLCVSQIYQYWDDYYRGKIADSLGMSKKNDLTSDVFGDIRYWRQAIIHHRAIALEDIEKYKVLNWFNKGDTIALSRDQVKTLMHLVKAEIIQLARRYLS